MTHFTLITMLLAAAFCVAASPRPDIQTMSDAEIKQHAAEAVAALHDQMLDPASFVLDGAYVTKRDKRGKLSVCYAFRSHNTLGGYAEGRAVEDGEDKNRLSVFNRDNGAGKFQGYDVGWFAPCKAKDIDREITADVERLAPGLYRKSK